MRYVIPSDSASTGRPPTEGFIIQESNTSIASTDGEIQTYFGSGSITIFLVIREVVLFSSLPPK